MVIPASLSELYPFESRFVEIDGNRLHYIDEGKGEVMLMVHGNPSWSFLWRHLINHFRKTYRVIALDHVGCGFSDRPAKGFDYRLASHVSMLTQFIDRLKLRDINLFVHDWGGAIGMGYAVSHPQNIRRIVLFNTAAFPSKRIPKRIAVCRLPFFGKLAIQGFNAFAKAATLMAVERKMTEEVKRGFLAPYDTYARRIATYEFVQDIPMSPSHPSWSSLTSIANRLPALSKLPIQLIWGGKDWCFDKSFLAEWQKRFPQANVDLIEDAGHYVLEDAPQRAVKTVESFMQGSVV